MHQNPLSSADHPISSLLSIGHYVIMSWIEIESASSNLGSGLHSSAAAQDENVDLRIQGLGQCSVYV